ncbi:tRNA-intron lyase [Candidatus Pacearchaeota archaeon]|nr:tRNA-intron lyase [Candidatus Pacearchaeota archaeon]MBD3283673.1 tRNA-intron lyase [Candidatus Pacearchaeota archaeon]
MKPKFPINLPSLTSNSQKALTLADTKKLGEKQKGKIRYSIYEAFYLFEQKKADIFKKNKLTEEQIIREFTKKDKEFYKKYLIFRYLRKKGYIVKTGLKFGSDFRVYEKNSKHAKYLVFPVFKNKINIDEFISKNRISHSTAKKLLIAIVDSEDNLSFFESDWIKP